MRKEEKESEKWNLRVQSYCHSHHHNAGTKRRRDINRGERMRRAAYIKIKI